MTHEQEALRDRARANLGIVGEDAPPEPSLSEVVARAPGGWYPLAALGLLGLIDAIDLQAFVVLGPEIKRAFRLTNVEVGLIGSLQGLAVVFGAIPLAALASRRSRAAIVKVSAVAWGVLQILTALARTPLHLGTVRTLRGLSDSSRQSIYLPLLSDSYPVEGRNRIFGAYYAISTAGTVIGPALIGVLGGVMSLSFRTIFPLTGLLTFVFAAFALRLKDPGYGRFDVDEIRRDVRTELGGAEGTPTTADGPELRFGEAITRLLAIRTLYRILIGLAVVGIGLSGSGAFITLFIERIYGLGEFGRGVVVSALGAAAAVGYMLGGRFGERLYRRDPASVFRLLGVLLAGYGAVLALSVFQPNISLFVAGQAIATAAVAAVLPGTFSILSAVVPPRLRGYSFAVQGIYIGFVGGLMGSVVIGVIADQAGYKVALSLVVIPSVIGGWIMARAGETFDEDLAMLADEIIEEERVASRRGSGEHIPLLEVRGCDFSYDQVQVLFDVDFDVAEGSIVALLGTNGAGKSTLLRAISGLGIPSRGTIRLDGANITYLSAERRVGLGIVHIPSGRAVFPTMSVIENLRMSGYAHGRDQAVTEERIDLALEIFGVLRDKHGQSAGSLSGGEQQMLALAKALILRPRLLCVDELSLGLAPKVVGELVEVLQRIREQGTTIVLVEQSVNLALAIADVAYFMEKGEIRFSGPAKDLLARDDLLRSVFLKGAARGLASAR